MAKRRIRVRRTALFLLAILAVLALLEMNRYLPGGWPGGGGDGGFRRWPVDAADRTRIRPPEGEVPPLPTEGVQVVLQLPGGAAPAEATVGVDRRGRPARRADPEGRVRLDDPDVLTAGVVVDLGGREVRHGPIDPLVSDTWIVHLPQTPPPSPGPRGPVTLEVVAAEDGRPLTGAPVTVRTPEGARVEEVGEDGRVELADLPDRTLVTVEAPGRRAVRRWVHPCAGAPVRIEVPKTPQLDARFVDADDGSSLTLTGLRLLTPAGEVLWRSEASLGAPVSRTLDVSPSADLADAILEVRTASHPVAHVPLAALSDVVRIPAGREFEVLTRDNDAQRLPGGRVVAHYIPDVLGPLEHRPAEPVEVTVEAGTTLALPAGTPARLLVEADASAPRTIHVMPKEASEREVRLDPGISLTVKVVAPDGAPVESAQVVVHATSDGLRVTRRGRTLADGRVKIRDLPGGPVEVYAHARGTAWAVAAADVERGGEGVEIPLVAGHRLRLAVESPLGLPLAGVRVRATPENDDAIEVVPPDAGPMRTGDEGTLVLSDLPLRRYRLRFTCPGYRDAVVSGVTPGPGVHFVTLLPSD